MKSVIITCVNYFNEQEVLEYIIEIFKQSTKHDIKIFIVDNTGVNFNKTLEDKIKKNKYTNVFILYPNKNLGYMGAANWALKQYLNSNDVPDWFILSNTDIKILSFHFLDKLIGNKSDEGVGVVAPLIISNISNQSQNPYMENRISRSKLCFYEWVFQNEILAYIYQYLSAIKKRSLIFIRKKNYKKQFIYAPHGAYMAFSKLYFEKGANLDYKAFLFYEEIYVAEMARKAGVKVLFRPDIVLKHFENSTTGHIKKGKILEHLLDSIKYCKKNFF